MANVLHTDIKGCDLSFGAHDGTTLELLSSSGDDVIFPSATGVLAGLMPAADKVKSDFITVTQAVDLDVMESDITQLQADIIGLESGLQYRGELPGNADLTGNLTGNTYVDGSDGFITGDFFNISSSGTLTTFDGTNIAVTAGDKIYINKNVASDAVIADADIDKVDTTDAVASVNGQIGVVVLDTDDIAEGANMYFTEARVLATDLLGYAAGAGVVAATDTVLQAFQKLGGGQTNAFTALGIAVTASDLGIGFTYVQDNSDVVGAFQDIEGAIVNINEWMPPGAELSTDTALIAGVMNPVNSSAGLRTMTAPAGTAGLFFGVSDSRGTASTNNIQVVFGADLLHGLDDDYIINLNRGSATFMYVNATIGWQMID